LMLLELLEVIMIKEDYYSKVQIIIYWYQAMKIIIIVEVIM